MKYTTNRGKALKLTLQSAAAKFNGRQYPFRLSSEEVDELKAAGIVIICGASDDLLEAYGAVRDETGSPDGGEFCLGSDSWLPVGEEGTLLDSESLATIEDVKKLAQEYDRSIKVKAEWDKDDYSWVISIAGIVEIPHAVFDVFEGDDKYCRAIAVFAPQWK